MRRMTLNRIRAGWFTAGALTIILAAMAAGGATARDDDDQFERGGERKPLVIGHRGASGYRPEHTLASYELAARMGADYIEPDLVITKDGVLVARHEPNIGGTTDVASHPEFTGRRTTKTIDGVRFEDDWFVEDFTLAELKTLRAKERIPNTRQENTLYDGRFEVPTLQEVIDLQRRLSKELDRDIGIYPETKHPTYFRGIGKPLEPALVRTLKRNGLDDDDAKVFVQSFEVKNLQALDEQLEVPLVQLFAAPDARPADGSTRTYGEMATAQGLRDIARYADGAGPSKGYIIPTRADGTLGQPTAFVRDAHAAGLEVHPYTFRNESEFLPPALRRGNMTSDYGDAFTEYQRFYEAGVDGLFSDNSDTAVEARRTFLQR
jgi:glycerophosphoryl diester phosphodiesterase